ncbi:sugar-transfer associated ATP-grasp domain-containing protein [Oceanobacillus profundus]|uniref:sugar-transfer associated ATP-grasp domain-containing protein n=1 Tax=Oceanobacillus TaxID=182709 RepID=UPI0026E1BA12|nr:sugar-transfer associated ATP-grasp domain-containing protein [Oceanobacillus profundus]MDO6451791.1 sugar-transfer associated ATP-grasp domain-containing protein [Oceanobacillus profundus]
MDYSKKILASTSNYKITAYTTGNSHKCIITFGEIDSKLDETGFASKLVMSEGYDHIYVAQKIHTQYQFLSDKNFFNIIKNIITNKEVFTYGSSLGAYCALYYGGVINANILALSPRIPAHPVINKLMGGIFKNKGFQHKELTNLKVSNKEVNIFYDKYNYIDNYYVNIFIKQAYPNANYYHISNAGHYTARALLLSGELKNVAKFFFENKELKFLLNKEKIIKWHIERTKKRLDQNKLFHARENIDVLLNSYKANDYEVREIIKEYRENLMSRNENKCNRRKENTTMNIKNETTTTKQDIFKKHNINTSKKAFSRFNDAGLLDNVDEPFLSDVNEFWNKHYGQKVDPILNLAFRNLTKNTDPRVIPSRIMWNELIPFFNDMNIRIGYSDKNIYDRMIYTPNAPRTILKRVRGHYFNTNNEDLNTNQALQVMLDYKNDLIIKPSDTDNGKGIKKIHYENNQLYLDEEIIEMKRLGELYGYNFTVQEVIKQHTIMAKPHPASVNTLRMVTLRWNNEIKYLLTFARFGANNSVKDNAGTGGLCIGITDEGEFLDFAIDENCKIYTTHPTTDYNFKDYAKIPDFNKYKDFVIELHKNILHHDFVSWDIAVGINNEPIFLEANYRGATWLYQLAAQRPLFGDLTEEILEYVSKELKKKDINKNVKSSSANNKNKKLQMQIDKLSKEKEKLKAQITKQDKHILNLTNENHSIRNSKSWRSTSILRKISKKMN